MCAVAEQAFAAMFYHSSKTSCGVSVGFSFWRSKLSLSSCFALLAVSAAAALTICAAFFSSVLFVIGAVS